MAKERPVIEVIHYAFPTFVQIPEGERDDARKPQGQNFCSQVHLPLTCPASLKHLMKCEGIAGEGFHRSLLWQIWHEKVRPQIAQLDRPMDCHGCLHHVQGSLPHMTLWSESEKHVAYASPA